MYVYLIYYLRAYFACTSALYSIRQSMFSKQRLFLSFAELRLCLCYIVTTINKLSLNMHTCICIMCGVCEHLLMYVSVYAVRSIGSKFAAGTIPYEYLDRQHTIALHFVCACVCACVYVWTFVLIKFNNYQSSLFVDEFKSSVIIFTSHC